MKKILGVLLITMMLSCESECETDWFVFQKIESKTSQDPQETFIVNEDTCVEGDISYEFIRINGDYTLTVLGDVSADVNIVFNGDGKVEATGSIIVNGNVFFLGGGHIEADLGLIITGHARDQNGLGGTITYCSFQSINDLDEGIILTQDCDNAVSCLTLGIPSISGYRYLGIRERPCDQEYEDGDYRFIKSK